MPEPLRVTQSQWYKASVRREYLESYQNFHDPAGRYYPQGNAPQTTPTRPSLPFAEPEPRPRLKLYQRPAWTFPSETPEPRFERRSRAQTGLRTSVPRGVNPTEGGVGLTATAAKRLPSPSFRLPAAAAGVAELGIGILADKAANAIVHAANSAIHQYQVYKNTLSPQQQKQVALAESASNFTAASLATLSTPIFSAASLIPKTGTANFLSAGITIAGNAANAGINAAKAALITLLGGTPNKPNSGQVVGGAIGSTTQTVDGSPPFTGGQSRGTAYLVTWQEVGSNGTVYSTNTNSRTGPLGAPYAVQQNGFFPLNWYQSTGTGPAQFTQTQANRFIRIVSVARSDGQPDTGGNPPPIQIEQPATSGPRVIPAEPPPEGSSNFTPAKLPKPLVNAEATKQQQQQRSKLPDPTQNPNVEPVPATALPQQPVQEPTGKPLIDPTGKPTGEPAPTATPENTPSKLPKQLQTTAAVGAAVAGATAVLQTVLRSGPLNAPKPSAIATAEPVRNATKPGEFTSPKQPPPRPPSETPTGNPCGCNVPVLDELGNLGRKIDAAGLGGEAVSTAALLAELEKIANAIGVGGLPANVPANLANPTGGTKNIGSLAELHLWQTEQLDGLLGQFPNSVSVETPDGTKELEMPNVSEVLSEILGMLTGQTIISSQILHTSSRALHQSGSATQQAHLAHLYSRANAEFLGYEGAATASQIPMAYSPGKNPFEGFLGESTQKIAGWENRDKDDLKKILAELLQAAQIIKGVFYKKVDPKNPIKEQIQADLRAQSTYLDAETQRKKNSSDWEQYLEQVEQGFSTKSGDTTPYGRPASERPKIRDLSSGTPDSDPSP